ncbi:MAG: hypothetical protein K2P58_13750 [Hyphomonadaceae bacterium]|nr:hypothetical protein [Hyphomonadaceae bacterium]
MLETMFIDNGALVVSARRGFETSGQQIWESWANDPGFASISATRREAIRVYLADDYPREATEEVLRGAPQALDAAGPRVSAMLNETQIAQLDGFLESDEGRTWFVAAIASGDGEYAPTPAESRAIDRFASQTNGQVWTEEFNQLVEQIAYDVIAYRAAAVRHRLFARVCELAGDECPPGFVPER